MPLPALYLVLRLDTGKRGNVAADTALSAVDEDVNAVVFVDEFVRVRCLFEGFLRIIVARKRNRGFGCGEFHAVLAADHEETRVAVVSVFLRDEVIVLEVGNFAAVYPEECARLAVAIVLVRSAGEERHIV